MDLRQSVPDYSRNYNRGWRASGAFALDRADMRCEPDAWYDGYLNQAAGRAKWHLATCADHDRCGQ